MSSTTQKRLSEAVISIASIIALLVSIRTIYLQYTLFRPMPYWDQWEFMKHLPDVLSGSYPLSELFAFHNEHRIVTSKLVFIADAFLFSSAGFFPAILLTCTIFALTAALCILVAQSMKDTLCTSAIFLSLLLSTAHSDNFSSGFQIQFAFVDLFAALSIGCLCFSQTRTRNDFILISGVIIADLISIFSMASGNIVIFSLLLTAFIIRTDMFKVIIFTLFATSASILYFQGFPSSDIAHSYAPLGLLHFSVAYLGSALRGYLHAPTILGATMLVLYTVVLLWVVRNRVYGVVSDRLVVWLVGLASFVLGGAFITATGRLSLGLDAAIASRYAIQSLLFLGCLFLIGWRIIDLRGYGRTAKAILAAFTLMISAASTFAGLPLREWRERVADYDVAGFALASGIVDDRATQGIYPRLDLIRSTLEFMALHHMGPFSAAYASVYRPPVNATALQDIERLPLCVAHIDEHVELSPEQTWTKGWIVAKDAPFQDGWVLAFNSKRQLLGAARQSIFRPDVSASLRIPVKRVGYKLGLNFHGVPAADRTAATLVLVPGQATAPTCRSVLPKQG